MNSGESLAQEPQRAGEAAICSWEVRHLCISGFVSDLWIGGCHAAADIKGHCCSIPSHGPTHSRLEMPGYPSKRAGEGSLVLNERRQYPRGKEQVKYEETVYLNEKRISARGNKHEGVMVYACQPSLWKAEAGGLPYIQG